MDVTFLNIDDNPDMGLNNTICTDKVYFCKSKRVYLSEDDMRNKKCMCKPTIDMIGERACAWLVKLEK